MCESNSGLLSKDVEINHLKEENKHLQSEIIEMGTRRSDDREIGIIIDNYEKI